MKEIALSGGFVALVDDTDLQFLSQWTWNVLPPRESSGNKTGYAGRRVRISGGGGTTVYMHRQIIGLTGNLKIDHINGNGLDNRKENLRVCTQSGNACNWVRPRKKAPYRGVVKNTRGDKWYAKIKFGPQTIGLGSFATPEEAARAYDSAARRLHGEFAILNFPA